MRPPDIFKEGDGTEHGGPPHRFTQPIPDHWLEGNLSEHRRRLLNRQSFSADTEDPSLPNAWDDWEPPDSQPRL